MASDPALDDIRRRIVPVLRRHGVRRAGVFGSYARGEATSQSDVDLLVELRPDASLLDLVALKLELEQALGRAADLVEYRAIHPLLRERVLREQVTVS